jgi:hypothetical protein
MVRALFPSPPRSCDSGTRDRSGTVRTARGQTLGMCRSPLTANPGTSPPPLPRPAAW